MVEHHHEGHTGQARQRNKEPQDKGGPRPTRDGREALVRCRSAPLGERKLELRLSVRLGRHRDRHVGHAHVVARHAHAQLLALHVQEPGPRELALQRHAQQLRVGAHHGPLVPHRVVVAHVEVEGHHVLVHQLAVRLGAERVRHFAVRDDVVCRGRDPIEHVPQRVRVLHVPQRGARVEPQQRRHAAHLAPRPLHRVPARAVGPSQHQLHEHGALPALDAVVPHRQHARAPVRHRERRLPRLAQHAHRRHAHLVRRPHARRLERLRLRARPAAAALRARLHRGRHVVRRRRQPQLVQRRARQLHVERRLLVRAADLQARAAGAELGRRDAALHRVEEGVVRHERAQRHVHVRRVRHLAALGVLEGHEAHRRLAQLAV
mmetsp:Transcript_4252/g.13728  ORF Transcript_4252/g.13728 Transcript_4252/m.13728 type:complete len:377 (-) Transcript_4252:1895-3025(-)